MDGMSAGRIPKSDPHPRHRSPVGSLAGESQDEIPQRFIVLVSLCDKNGKVSFSVRTRNWSSLESGLIVPDGYQDGVASYLSDSYLEVKEKAIALEERYSYCKARISPHSDLSNLIRLAKKLSDDWFLGVADKLPIGDVFSASLLNRVADALLSLSGDPKELHYLNVIASKSLRLLDRGESHAKDILWELELYSAFKSHGLPVKLGEPDIIVSFPDVRIGVACKKIYRMKRAGDRIRSAVKQMENSFDVGVIAINIDDLLPKEVFLKGERKEEILAKLAAFNMSFMHSCEHTLRKYIGAGRLSSVLVSSAAISSVKDHGWRLGNARQISIWIPSSLDEKKESALELFYKVILGLK